ncbi:putative DNA repair and recombination protein [Diplonema papillatum]|nr:putative DNA repair and recombination protein [Diplonema papillatum]
MTCEIKKAKIKVFDANTGVALGKWGGNTCFLTKESDLGPCLAVRSVSQPVSKATFYKLPLLKDIIGMVPASNGICLPAGVKQGLLSLTFEHMNRQVTVQIRAENTAEYLTVHQMAELLAKVLAKSTTWDRLPLEVNAGTKKRSGADRETEDAAAHRLLVEEALNAAEWKSGSPSVGEGKKQPQENPGADTDVRAEVPRKRKSRSPEKTKLSEMAVISHAKRAKRCPQAYLLEWVQESVVHTSTIIHQS